MHMSEVINVSGEGIVGQLHNVDPSEHLSGCSFHDDGCVVDDSIAIYRQ